jgi:hypothetical protein
MNSVLDGEPDGLEIANYSTEIFGFRLWLSNVFGTPKLEELHRFLNVTPDNFQRSVHDAQILCESRTTEIQDMLDHFFRTVVVPKFGAVLSWQQLPTFRTHFAVEDPNLEQERQDLASLGPARFLRKHYFDSYRPAMFHRDKDYGLAPGTLNLWVPVTDVAGANSLWIGGNGLRGRDSLPVTIRHGQCLFFDGANRWHGVVWNTSPTTRVSFDIRFVPQSAVNQLGGTQADRSKSY